MKEFKLSNEKIARVWLNEWPIDAKHSSNITNDGVLTAQYQGSLKCTSFDFLNDLNAAFN